MNRYLTIDEEIYINQFTQGLHNLQEMNSWFKSFDLQNKRDILENVLYMVLQSHPTYEELEASAQLLKKTKSTSAIMLMNKNKPFHKFGYQICDLPEPELLNGFDILIITLTKSDNRRKIEESDGECQHWWHKDLSDERYLESIREKYKNKGKF